jgi:hypothetical protein
MNYILGRNQEGSPLGLETTYLRELIELGLLCHLLLITLRFQGWLENDGLLGAAGRSLLNSLFAVYKVIKYELSKVLVCLYPRDRL